MQQTAHDRRIMGGDAPAEPNSLRPSALLTSDEWQGIVDRLRLAHREMEIAQALMDGFDERGIAMGIGISEHTVHTYMQRLYRKLGVKNRCEVITRVFVAFLEEGGRNSRAPMPPKLLTPD